MRPLAVIAVVEAAAIVGLLVVVVVGRERAVAAEGRRWAGVVESMRSAHGAVIADRAELLDRIQMPEAAVAFSQSGRAVAEMQEEALEYRNRMDEKSVGEQARETDEFLRAEFERRGIDPSEALSESGRNSGVG